MDAFYKTDSVLWKIGIVAAIIAFLLAGLWALLACAEKRIL